MILKEEAIKIAKEYLLECEKRTGIPVELVESETIEKEYGWVFFYESTEYLKSGDFLDRLAGNAPIIINKYSGEVYITGTAESIDYYLNEYEQTLKNNPI